MFALLFLLLTATAARSQGNDFPFFPNVPAPNQPFVPGPSPQFPECCAHTTAWGTQMLWGVEKGDIVYFELQQDYTPLTAHSVIPRCETCSEMNYLEPTDGSASVHARYYWPEWWGGYHCAQCRWSARAGDDNPTFWVEYYGPSLPFLNPRIVITGIEKAPPLVHPTVSQRSKNRARTLSIVAGGASGVLWTAMGYLGSQGQWGMAGIFGLAGFGTAAIGAYADRVALDPFTWAYNEVYQWTHNQEMWNQFYWTCDWVAYQDPDGYMNELCWGYVNATFDAEALMAGFAESADRRESALAVGDQWWADEQLRYVQWYAHQAADALWWQGWYQWRLADIMDWYNVNGTTGEDSTGWLRYNGQESMNAWSDFASE